MHSIAAKSRFYREVSGMVKETWLSFTTGTLMAPSRFLASSALLGSFKEL